MPVRLSAVVVLALASLGCAAPAEPPPSGPESVFLLVRHAEKVDQTDESPLTEVGQARAETLARMLRDAGVDGIYSSDFRRTRDTAAPLARELGLEVALYDTDGLPELADALLSSPGRYLVVGHSNTTPELAGLLGGDPGSPISEDEYDRLYVVHRRPGSDGTTLILRFEPGSDVLTEDDPDAADL
ncbi:MAG: phosphoglycerate mutase family protein [Gemmatimonadota bacterium]|jgi:phosphohistidine phosphatase SixA